MQRNPLFFPGVFSKAALAAVSIVVLMANSASATTISGTLTFSGDVSFPAPIPGITADDLTVFSGPGIEATGNGEQCVITVAGSAPVGVGGTFPESGTLSVGLELSHGGMAVPDGGCLLQLRAGGNDGGSVSAHGTVTVAVTAADISGNASVAAGTIIVRQSKTQAGLSTDCLKWIKKQVKAEGKCNAALWKLGGAAGSLKCTDAGVEPVGCDSASYVNEIVALSFGDMNQQAADRTMASLIDLTMVADQAKCQRYIGKAATNWIARRNSLVQKSCVDLIADDGACRDQAGKDSNTKLSVIDNCVTTQATDTGSGLVLADVGEPCRSQCISAGTIDRKCLKSCLELELGTLSDGMIGDVPECGNGVLQSGEACDDGNVVDGDCCSSTCTAEPAGTQSCGVGACQVMSAKCSAGAPATCTPGTPGTETSPAECVDGVDNDCDGTTDAADLGCP